MSEYAPTLAAIYTRAADDAAGAALRALTGGAESIFPLHLVELRAAATPRPARPWLVWSGGLVVTNADGMQRLVPSWWVYDDPPQGEYRIRQIVGALTDLYGTPSRYALDGGRLDIQQVTRPHLDKTVGLMAVEVRLTFRTR